MKSATQAALAFCLCAFIVLVAFYHRQSLMFLPDQLNRVTEDKEQMGILHRLLRKAEMKGIDGEKTVIFTSTNGAWAQPGSLFDILLESFRILRNRTQEDLLEHLVVLAFDQVAYDRCVDIHPLCYQVITDGINFTSYKPYMSHDYIKMMWRRIEFLITVLDMGYSFIFSDADVIWLRNPFPYLQDDKDFQITTDRYNGHADSHDNAPNGGYTFARSNTRTIEFYRFWYNSRLTYPTMHDQDAFIHIRHNKSMEDIQVRIGYLDTKIFSSFCSHWLYNMNVSVTIHANCCNGLNNKVRNLKAILNDWKEFIVNNTKERAWQRPNGCVFSPV